MTDLANVLSPATEAEINHAITALEAKNGSELAVVTVPEVSLSTPPKEFATALLHRWRVGKQGQDNGVLFLVSINDRRVEVETGYGAEAVLPDARVGRILHESVVPYFLQRNYETGILSGTQALVAVLEQELVNPPRIAASRVTPFYVWIAAAGG